MVAAYDDDPARGRGFAERFGIPDFYASPGELVACDEIDAVVVCSPTNAHAALVIAAAGHGKHVLCEKPIATRLADAEAMVAACEEAGVQLHLAYTSRFYPMMQEAKRLIASGEIGDVVGICGGNRGTPPLLGDGEQRNWLLDPVRAGGGALIDHSVHVTDVMRYLVDAEVESVYAEVGTLIHRDLEVEDCAVLLLRFQNGMVASVDPSWSIPTSNPYHYDLYLHILGEQGAIKIDDTRQSLQVVRGSPDQRGLHNEPFGLDIDAELVKSFIRSIRRSEPIPPCASGVDGLRSLEIALAAYESVRTGQPVRLACS